MSPQQREFLSLERFPARLNCEQTAWRLGFQVHDIPILVAAGLIQTLGHPAPNAPKFFASAQIEMLHADSKWLARATDAIQRHWQRKNSQRRTANAATLTNP